MRVLILKTLFKTIHNLHNHVCLMNFVVFILDARTCRPSSTTVMKSIFSRSYMHVLALYQASYFVNVLPYIHVNYKSRYWMQFAVLFIPLPLLISNCRSIFALPFLDHNCRIKTGYCRYWLTKPVIMIFKQIISCKTFLWHRQTKTYLLPVSY